MGVYELVNEEATRQFKGLPLFSVDRSVALQSVIIAFELAVADLFADDELAAIKGETMLLSHSWESTKFENAICGLVPKIWSQCPNSGTYNTAVTKESIGNAVKAFELQIKIDIANQALYASRFGNFDIEVDGQKIRAYPIESITRWEPISWVREDHSRFELAKRGVSEVQQEERKRYLSHFSAMRVFLGEMARVHGFEDDMLVGQYTLDDFLRSWGGLLAVIGSHAVRNVESLAASKDGLSFDPRQTTIIIRERDLRRRISEYAQIPVAVVERICSDLMYQGSQHQSGAFLYPLIGVGQGFIVLGPNMISGNNPVRNLRQRLILNNPSAYGRIRQQLSDNMVRDLVHTLERQNHVVRSGKVLRDQFRMHVTDIDILALRQNYLLVIQVKNINPPDSYEENVRATDEAAKAEKQLEQSIGFVQKNLKSIVQYLCPDQDIDIGNLKVVPLIVTGARLQFTNSGPRWTLVDVVEFEKTVEEIEKDRPPYDTSVIYSFKRFVGHMTIGKLEFEIGLGGLLEPGETYSSDIDLNRFERFERIQKSLSWKN